MVGVPRSMGCRECRRKKKGCDLVRPKCSNCKRLGVDCVYQERRWTFVTPRAKVSPASSTLKESKGSHLVILDRSLSRLALEIQILDAFWTNYLPKNACSTIYIDRRVDAPWKQTILNLSHKDGSISNAILACAFMSTGRTDNHHGLVQQGRAFYCRSLNETNKALQDPVRVKSDAVLAACKVLSLYETFRQDAGDRVTTQGFDWAKHVDGICRIIELRGPELHLAQHGLDLLEDARLNATISGMIQKRPNYITNLQFQVSAVTSTQQPKHLRAHLLDVMLYLPDLLHQQERLNTSMSSIKTVHDFVTVMHQGQDLLDHAIHIGEILRSWERLALASSRSARGVPPASPDPAASSLYGICQRHGYDFFYSVNLFWVASHLVQGLTHMTWQRLAALASHRRSPDGSPVALLRELPSWIDPRPFAVNIAHTCSHFFHGEAGLWGAQASTLPIGTAFHYFALRNELDGAEAGLLRAALSNTPRGKMASDFVRSMGASAAGAAQRNGMADPSRREDHLRMASRWWHGTPTSLQQQDSGR